MPFVLRRQETVKFETAVLRSSFRERHKASTGPLCTIKKTDMIKKQFLFGIIAVALTSLVFLFKYNSWPGAGNIIYLSIIILFILTLFLAIRKKKQRSLLLVTGLFWIAFTIVLSGACFKMMNWSNTVFWPTSNLVKKMNFINVEYQSYAWPVSAPERFGIKESLIEQKLIGELETLDYPLSLLIIKNDTLITEKYFRGTSVNTAFNTQSATKSFVSVLIGIAIDKGLIKNENVRIKDLIPEYYNATTETKKDSITIKHLLTMQAGWDNNDNRNLKGYDWIGSAMSNKLQYQPGTSFLYTNIGPCFLIQILEKQSGQSTMDFTNTNLCSPLNITIADWLKTPNGKCMGGGPLFMTSRDMARFGQLLIKRGTINGKKILDSTWIKKSTMNYVRNSLMSDEVPAKGYGYLMWIDNYKNHEIWLAAGAGGQYIMMVPDLNMILVTTTITNLPSELQNINALHILKLLNDFVYSLLEEMNNYQ
jgi:CubicO group peptidase (beta-lactamase class C family)